MTSSIPKRRWVLIGAALLLLAGGALGAWWWWRPPAVEPPMPQDIQEAEVRRAIELARQDVLDKPYSGAAWGHLGMTLLAHLFDREADRCFAEAARLAPAEPWWPYARGVIALKRDPDGAVGLLRQAVRAADSRLEDRSAMSLQLAEALLERQQRDEAEAIFRDEWERGDRDNPRAALGLGLIAVDRGDSREAEEFLTAARGNPFARKVATAQLAALARVRGDATAADEYQKEVAALPDPPPWPDPVLDRVVRLQVGHRGRERQVGQLEKEGHFAEAAEVYLRQIEEEPTARDCVGAGINLVRVGDYNRALPLLRQAVRLDPASAQAHYTLGLAQFVRAEKMRRQDPDSSEVKEWLGEAIEESRRATELKPDHARAYLHWGLSLKYLGDPAAAVAPLRRGVDCRPADFDLQLALGEALLESGQPKEAETYLENARRLDPKDPRLAAALERLRPKKD
jgi:tetratricopeptide (TPR) repeat protein